MDFIFPWKSQSYYFRPLPYNSVIMFPINLTHVAAILGGSILVIITLYSAVSTFVLPRSAGSLITRVVFRGLRSIFNLIVRFSETFQRRDAIMAYFAPLSLMLLLPAWYLLIALGYTAIYWALGAGDLVSAFELSGSHSLRWASWHHTVWDKTF